ncbi:MAG: CoA activase, partial [Candidatus Zixiibacteriota bacterium]
CLSVDKGHGVPHRIGPHHGSRRRCCNSTICRHQAEKLKVNINREFGDRALCARCPVGCGERCTVFMESDLVAHQRSGANLDDLIAGLAYSIASNYLNKVVGDRRVGENIFFQGGVAWNKGVVAAFEKLTGKTVTVPPHHDVTGAIGAAILAIEKTAVPGFETRFKGFDLHKRKYTLSTFNCEDCTNHCEIRTVELEGEEPLYYGARCEKYDVDTDKERVLPPDYPTVRQRLLFRRYLKPHKSPQSRGRVGFPRVLHFFDLYPFWRAFFDNLDYTVIASDVTSHKIVEESLETFSAETCFPIKLVYGHVANLLAKKADIIFMPSVIKMAAEHEGADEGGYICPYVQTIGSSLKARFDFEAAGARLVCPPMMLSYSPAELRQSLRPLQAELGLSDRQLKRAIEAGLLAYRQYQAALQIEGRKILADLEPGEKAMVLVSRPYNGFDRRLSLDLPGKARNLGLKVIPLDFLPIDGDSELGMDNMYWSYGRRILKAANFIRKHPNLYAVYITSFGCGPDSFITHFFHKAMSGKPYLQLELDEHSADAGLITRIEAFVDSLRFYEFKPPVSSFSIRSDHFRPFEKTIYIPNMCDHAYAVRAAMERHGLTAEVLDEPDELTLELGKKFTSGKECFPCQITTGDIIKKIRSEDFDASRAVFFMPGASGPCRFGLYSQYHRLVLDELGYKDIPVFSPTSEDGYKEFGLEGSGFRSTAWKGIVFIDCLVKARHRVRPYELNPGETDRTYSRYLRLLNKAALNDESILELSDEAAKDFARIPVAPLSRPLVGVVGEIYLRSNRFSNNYLIDKLESLGMEVWLATFAEWPLYTSLTYRRDSWTRNDWRGWASGSLQSFVQDRQERKIVNRFSCHLDIGHDYPVAEVLKLAEAYIPYDVKGEAILSIGKAIEMFRQGASGIVNAMPFNCMPGTIVSSLSRKISDDHNRIPWLNISYEGLRDSGEDTRLEAFAEQVDSFMRADPGSHTPHSQVAAARNSIRP